MQLPIRQYFDLLSKYLRPQQGRVTLLGLFLLGAIGLHLFQPQILRTFIDTAQAGAAGAEMTRIALIYMAVTLLNQALRTSSAYLTEDVKWKATNWLRNDLSRHCMALDMNFHNEYTPGKMIERIDGDVTELSNFFSQFVLRVLGNGIFMLGVLALLYREAWFVGLLFTAMSILIIAALMKTVTFGVPFWKERREASSHMFGLIEEWLGGTEDIRASGGTGYVMDKLRRAIYRNFIATRKAFIAGNLTWAMNSILFGLNSALALGLGAYLFWQGNITLGTVYLLFSYSNQLRRPLEQLAHELRDLQAATASIQRISELFTVEPAIREIDAPIPLPKRALSVAFNDVTFGYVDDELILQAVDFQLEAGKVMGLLGRTGSGKTTMTRLLFRLHDPTTGTVCLGGESLCNVAVSDVRGSVGMVTQEVQLFQASVRDNLTFFDSSISDQHILEALEILGLESWYTSLDEGLDTQLASSGKGLSAGEAQLLAFTRVFLKDPGLVILDEASSRLDPVTEQLIERAIDRLLHNRTAIIVAHRLATVQRADEIMILRDGQISEHGERLALLSQPDSQFNQLLQTGLAAGVLAEHRSSVVTA